MITLPTSAGRCTSLPSTSSARNASDKRLAVDADLRVDLSSEQYFAGRDRVLERALKGL